MPVDVDAVLGALKTGPPYLKIEWDHFRLAANFDSHIGKSVVKIVDYHRNDPNSGGQYFIIIDDPKWEPKSDVFVVTLDEEGAPDVLRLPIGEASSACTNLDIANMKWNDWFNWDKNERFVRQGYKHFPELPAGVFNLANGDGAEDGDEEAFKDIMKTINAGINKRRSEDHDPQIARYIDKDTLGSDEDADVLNQTWPSVLIIVDQPALDTKNVLAIHVDPNTWARLDECRLAAEVAGEYLRWMGMGFCKWRQWDVIMGPKLEEAMEELSVAE
ncbi:hypothetical protein BU16DRAFT_533837 [Lophium mytilinum]|uniref:DUF6924 domain-containing protein n=1 Tax=Lophium mytilinum TaxID=390894 RepID=A0A6A6RCE9_9PEZI|nr:hypothetical protein BU16DRAFT_533837 [Lophium mytilinum]